MDHSAQAVAVSVFAIAWTAACFATVHTLRAEIVMRPLGITYVALAWTVIMIVFAACVSAVQSDPSGGLFTTTTWFSAGWRAGLSVFGIKVNSWWRYCIVLAFQISRSILGSLLTNIFRPHLTVKVQTIGTGRKALTRSETNAVVAAQASWNIFGFVASLSDSFLMLSQIDLSIITLVVTMLADSQSTYFIGEVDAKRTDTGSDCNSLNPTSVGSLKLKD